MMPEHQDFFDAYEAYREPSITQKRFKHADIFPLIQKLESPFEVKPLGLSLEGRAISLVKIGTGEIPVLLWSQMHGDEPTATMALMDVFNFLGSNDQFDPYRKFILDRITLYFIPMLNPDGAERFQRRTALGIDMNRDALRLASPEAKILKHIRDSLQAVWGFNLHDQSRYYGVGQTNQAAAFSFLAPAYNYEKDVNEVRERALRLIGQLSKVLGEYVPGKIARYNDDFEPRAFGDNIQKWGTSTILIESGGYQDDSENQYLRKLHFVVLLEAFRRIADGSFSQEPLSAYDSIPYNRSGSMHDLILRGVEVEKAGKWHTLDVAFMHDNFQRSVYISELGDLSVYHGYREFDAKGYQLVPGDIYPKIIRKQGQLDKLTPDELLARGITTLRLRKKLLKSMHADSMLSFISTKEEPNRDLRLGSGWPVLLRKDGEFRFYISDGKLHPVR